MAEVKLPGGKVLISSHKQTNKQADRQASRQADSQASGKTCMHACMPSYIPTYIHAYIHTYNTHIHMTTARCTQRPGMTASSRRHSPQVNTKARPPRCARRKVQAVGQQCLEEFASIRGRVVRCRQTTDEKPKTGWRHT